MRARKIENRNFNAYGVMSSVRPRSSARKTSYFCLREKSSVESFHGAKKALTLTWSGFGNTLILPWDERFERFGNRSEVFLFDTIKSVDATSVNVSRQRSFLIRHTLTDRPWNKTVVHRQHVPGRVLLNVFFDSNYHRPSGSVSLSSCNTNKTYFK